jgi:ribosomal protein S18 acetylase RimI-like enzyme
MGPWQRAINFMRRIDERASEQVVPFPRGKSLINRRLRRVHDANYVLAQHLDGATAEELIAEAERIQGPLGLSHRRVNVDDQVAAPRLAPEFERRGYIAEEFLIMAVRRAADRPVNLETVKEVTWGRLREAREIRRLAEPWGSPQVVEQILAREELTATLVPTTYFGIVEDDLVVSSCELRMDGNVAQVETVETLANYRNRGYARAVVTAAVRAARDREFIFLVADKDDWPQHMYRRLGFETVGIESRFLRLLDA